MAEENAAVQFIWYDYACMYQGEYKGGKREGRGKGKTSYSGTGKKAWFEMFPAVTKRSKNATKKRKGAVRG